MINDGATVGASNVNNLNISKGENKISISRSIDVTNSALLYQRLEYLGKIIRIEFP